MFYQGACYVGFIIERTISLQGYAGGNRYEGGAGSIYSGWTNAPIALAMLLTGKLSSEDSWKGGLA